MAMNNIVEIDGKKYRKVYYNTCCRCALRPDVTGRHCPVEDCDDSCYYREVKEKGNDTEREI